VSIVSVIYLSPGSGRPSFADYGVRVLCELAIAIDNNDHILTHVYL
jgi:hypothetical protein